MLTKKQLSEIREHLERAQNPVFFYDNDADGFCSYVLFRRFLGRGKGVAVRTHPNIDAGYAKKAQEFGSDYVFILDRPFLGKEFVEEIEKLQLPIVWIDHHDIKENINDYGYDNIFVYNPTRTSYKKSKKSNEPVTYLAYKVVNRKEDVWIAVMGCISDHYMPDFIKEFAKEYSEYWRQQIAIEKPFDAYYKTEIGFLARALGFGLKDSITHVVQLQNFLVSCKSPADVLSEIESNRPFGKKYRELRKKYDLLIEKAKKNVDGKIIFFCYGGNLSISSDISNELSFLYPGRFIIVGYMMESISNLSIRGDDVKSLIEKLLPRFKDSRGGGHRNAVGVRLQTEDLERFKKEFEEEVNRKNARNKN
ncbi:MAG: hypothetical protein IIA87_01070 [Nanoarchaeota archaeon]|nr:hypothetical protein [Nanoarchaeota archaeon]